MPNPAPMPPTRLLPAALMFALAFGLLALAWALRSRAGNYSAESPRGLTLTPAGPSAFRADAFPPDLPGRDALPALGSWMALGSGITDVWTSAPLTTSAAFLQFRVSGTLRPPSTSLVLRTADGREIAPLEIDFSSHDRWKRINFPAPTGPFQIVAKDDDPTDWLLIALAGSWRQMGLWIAAGLPCAAWLAWYNHTLYGSAFVTGYGDQTDHFFGLNFVLPTLRSYALLLPLLFTPLIVLGLAGPFLRGISLRLRLMLSVWAGVILAFYACYWCTADP